MVDYFVYYELTDCLVEFNSCLLLDELLEDMSGFGVNVSGVTCEVFCESEGDCEGYCALSVNEQVCIAVSNMVEVILVVAVRVSLIVTDCLDLGIKGSIVFRSEFVGVKVRISHANSIPFLVVFWQVAFERYYR